MSIRPYNCRHPGCSKIFKWRTHRNRHERYAHRPPKYRCPISDCNQSFKRKDYLSTHIKYVHYFDESKQLHCPYPGCNQSFKRKGDLKVHIRHMHSEALLNKCPYPNCNKTYRRKSSLNEHIRFVHQDYRPHICKKCGKRFRQVQLLRNHLEHKLCLRPPVGEIRAEYIAQHHNAVNNLGNFLRETKNPKSIGNEVVLPNECRLDLLVYCPDNRIVGFDVTIGRSTVKNLRDAILEKFDRNYEKFCDLVYIFVISNSKHTHQTIQECNRSSLKLKMARVVHWRSIIRDNPKYVKIFQEIEDEAVLLL